jgi:tetratricopeptide (TPR) repeat protein
MRRIAGAALGCLLAVSFSSAQSRAATDPLTVLDRAMAAAESSLREEEMQIAESRYRSALFEGWMLLGHLESAEGRLTAARDAFRRASTSTVDPGPSLYSLTVLHMQLGESSDAVAVASRLARANPKDAATRRLYAQTLVADGHPEEAVQELEEARGASPDDPELAFALASGYLQLKKVEAAERLFGAVIAAKSLPATHVLIGRTYRDAGYFERARASFEKALKMDPRVPRAHYYLGTLGVMSEGVLQLDEAIKEFRLELKLTPADPATNLRLGMALVEAQRAAEALPALRIASRADTASAVAFYYLGRCQLALDQTSEAIASLRRALELVQELRTDGTRVGQVHYQLGVALRRQGAAADAARHFAEAERFSAEGTDRSRKQLARYLEDAPNPEVPATLAADRSPLATLPRTAREELRRRVAEALTRASFNLGVIHAQAQRFARAADFFARAAELNPVFPQVQYSLGVAYFNAKQFQKAVVPLTRAHETAPGDASVRRMLALSCLNAEQFEKAAELLRNDPQRDSDPSLQYAYGLALVRSDRGADAEVIFDQLLAAHADNAEVNVLLGQAHAQQGDFDAAVKSLQRALQIKPDVGEANAALGVIYLRQGKLTEAADALRAELKIRPDDLQARYHLATALDRSDQRDEAIAIVRTVVRAKPDYANARYLFGKLLLAQGDAVSAVEHLEAAARNAPEDANIFYQLGRAYQKLGRPELAEQRFERYRQLQDKRRDGIPKPDVDS